MPHHRLSLSLFDRTRVDIIKFLVVPAHVAELQ